MSNDGGADKTDPPALQGTLRDYQKRGVAWLQYLEQLNRDDKITVICSLHFLSLAREYGTLGPIGFPRQAEHPFGDRGREPRERGPAPAPVDADGGGAAPSDAR